jgi:hypothetical protein
VPSCSLAEFCRRFVGACCLHPLPEDGRSRFRPHVSKGGCWTFISRMCSNLVYFVVKSVYWRGVWVDDLGIWVWFPVVAMDFYLLQGPRRALRLTQPPARGYRRSFLGLKWRRREVEHWLPSSAENKDVWPYTFSPRVYLRGVDRNMFTFTLTHTGPGAACFWSRSTYRKWGWAVFEAWWPTQGVALSCNPIKPVR